MTLYTSSGTLHPTAPFDFGQTLKFLRMFMPAQGEQTTNGDACIKAFLIDGRVVVVKVGSQGSIEQPQLAYTLYSETRLNAEDQQTALDRLRFYLSLDDDLRTFYTLAENDQPFLPVLQRLYGLHQVKFSTPFENACWAILSQRTYMNIARKSKDAVVEHYGSALEVDGVVYRAFPDPEALAGLNEDELNIVVRNERKSACLLSAARAFAQVDEQWLRSTDYDTVEAWLRQIKGIGEWSASFVLIRGLGRMERISRGEEKLAQAVQKFYGSSDPKPLAQRYGDLQGYWAYYLRVADG